MGKQPSYYVSRYGPLWAACAELKMPVYFHSGPASQSDYFAPEPDGSLAVGAMGIYTSVLAQHEVEERAEIGVESIMW